MLKHKLIKHFRRMPEFEQKAEFMKRNGVRFMCDQHHNVTIFADDGTLQLFPLVK